MAQQPLVGQGLLIIEASRSHSLRHTTLGRTPLDEWSARRRDLYLTTHNTHKRQTSMPPTGFEPTILASERPQTHALDRAVSLFNRHTPYAKQIKADFKECHPVRVVNGTKKYISMCPNTTKFYLSYITTFFDLSQDILRFTVDF
jgi:hypothetical protein